MASAADVDTERMTSNDVRTRAAASCEGVGPRAVFAQAPGRAGESTGTRS